MIDPAQDQVEFADLVAPYRRELHVHCYRMLGSVTYADDLLQDVMLAAWQNLDRFEGRSSLRTWLFRIATNRCLNAIRDGRRRPAEVPLPPFDPPHPTSLGEVNWLQPYPDRWLDEAAAADPARRLETRDTISLAFVAALQRVPPRQAAVVILYDVLEFPLADIASLLDSTQVAVKGLLQRGRSSLSAARTGTGTQDDAPSPRSAAGTRGLADRFAAAFAADDIDAMVGMLTDRAWLRMPPARHEYRGAHAIGAFLDAGSSSRAGRRFELATTAANRQPAYVCRIEGDPVAVLVLDPTADGINELTLFVDPAIAVRQAGSSGGAVPSDQPRL